MADFIKIKKICLVSSNRASSIYTTTTKMKKLYTTLSFGLLLTGISHAATLVLFDFEEITANGAATATASGQLAATTSGFVTSAQNSTNLRNGTRGGSTNPLAGTASESRSFTTSGGGSVVNYDSFSFFIGSNAKAYNYSFTYNYAGLASPVTFGDGTTGSTTNFAAADTTDFVTFSTSEIVTFTLTSTGVAAGGNDRTRFDDFNIQGSVVPEPSSFALFGLGLGVLAFRRRRNG
ncbi:PEP-CTERM sorting domain-containing protein [Luteolibacter sp. AS25]|uniref:PEP-CTERM sorting domain-containing protein n=1 Tax=Luteolibacter sp. AS25 TaxID=3135776 RepID=UPI00398AFF64